jgi:hypothetical protein
MKSGNSVLISGNSVFIVINATNLVKHFLKMDQDVSLIKKSCKLKKIENSISAISLLRSKKATNQEILFKKWIKLWPVINFSQFPRCDRKMPQIG